MKLTCLVLSAPYNFSVKLTPQGSEEYTFGEGERIKNRAGLLPQTAGPVIDVSCQSELIGPGAARILAIVGYRQLCHSSSLRVVTVIAAY